MRRPFPDDLIDRLRAVVGEDNVSTSAAILDAHAGGESSVERARPDVVCSPSSTEEVAAVVRLCGDTHVAIIAHGAGTSLEGQLAACMGGVSLDLTRLNAILDISPADLDCRVQAGVDRETLNHALRDQGLFFPLDPGANATIGGMVATRASGTNAVRYGTMRDVVLGLTVVLADGRIIKTGGRARKSSSGYDLTRLFIGSEGTLGIVTEVQLRLFGIPEHIASGVAQFATLDDAISSVIAILQMGVPIARIELLDALQMQASISYSKLDDFEPLPSLFVEFHGGPASVAEQIATVGDVFDQYGGQGLRWAERTEERNSLWKARHDAYWAGRALQPGCGSLATDACVPISMLANAIQQARKLADEASLICPIVGHVGDGNFHMNILFDENDTESRSRAEQLASDIAYLAISLGGTATGEHGIGLHKLSTLEAEHGEAVETMRHIKTALDPENILNPGKTVARN